MGRYAVIPQDTFDALQLDAGVLLTHFEIEQAAAGGLGFTDDDLICATTGGINSSCVPEFSDFGEDVDNCPNNMKELKHLDGWNCEMSTTSLGTSARLIKLSLGCADLSETGTSVIPRADLSQDDFSNLWWVGDKANGGFVAIKLMNALSTGGFSLQTSKNGKGQTSLAFSGHVSINAQKVVPMEFYSIDSGVDDETELESLTIGSLVLTPGFEPDTTTYVATTSNESDIITATAADSGATVVIKNGTTTVTNGSSAEWTDGNNIVTITVTNGTKTAVYTVTVSKGD